MQYLYLIQCKANQFFTHYKIGIANDVQTRLATLQTGNPFELELIECYGFENAEIVERAIHQAFKKQRIRGEWFELNSHQVEDEFPKICVMLGGFVETVESDVSTDDEVEEAEEMISHTTGGKWDYQAMFAEGWRIEPSSSKGKNGVYWAWRKTENGKRPYIYGGLISELPHPMSEMRRIFMNG